MIHHSWDVPLGLGLMARHIHWWAARMFFARCTTALEGRAEALPKQ